VRGPEERQWYGRPSRYRQNGHAAVGKIDFLITRVAKRLKVSRKTMFRLVKTRRMATHPIGVMERRRSAAQVLEGSKWRGFLPRVSAFKTFAKEDIPGLGSVVAICQRVLAGYEPENVKSSQSKKPFFSNLLTQDDLAAQPGILEFAISPAVTQIVTDYLGAVPRMHCLGIFVSPPTDTLISSQCFHLDEHDFNQVKIFVNLHDVTENEGPFTFLPAPETEAVCRAVGKGWGSGRLTDEEVLGHTAPEKVVRLTGAAGEGAFVDSSRCLHYGSRTHRGRRAVLMIQYVPAPDALVEKDKPEMPGYPLTHFPPEQVPKDGVARLMLAPHGFGGFSTAGGDGQ